MDFLVFCQVSLIIGIWKEAVFYIFVPIHLALEVLDTKIHLDYTLNLKKKTQLIHSSPSKY